MFAFDLSKPLIGKADIGLEKTVADVFDYVGFHFFDNYPKWALEVIEFEVLQEQPIGVGSRAKQVRIEQGQKVESTFEITEFMPLQKFALESVNQEFREVYTFKENEESDFTRLEISFELLHVDFFMRPFEKLIRVAIEEGLQNSLENILTLLCGHYGGSEPV
ncbi:MAG: hypothetical protein KJ725_04250 [Gammaproteobacteria bacterium]|nr:hypothetical protein [Gammaproteobacteria bacterium]